MGYILLTEDDALLNRMYQEKLEHDGYTVKTAGNGEDALTLIKKEKPDIVLLDIMMPIMNGLEVLKRLKANPKTKHIPVLMLSNLAGGIEPEEAMALGADAYMVKAENLPDTVVEKIKEVLAKTT
jgi:CheY-like chemotaxis protein